jgi:hypothetical protein
LVQPGQPAPAGTGCEQGQQLRELVLSMGRQGAHERVHADQQASQRRSVQAGGIGGVPSSIARATLRITRRPAG